jgi:hypothetical protein
VLTITCACCQRQGTHHARGLTHTCYSRHRGHRTLDRYPPTMPAREPWQPVGPHGRRMLDRYQQLASIRPKPSTARIAFELGVTERQVYRYAAAIAATQDQPSHVAEGVAA